MASVAALLAVALVAPPLCAAKAKSGSVDRSFGTSGKCVLRLDEAEAPQALGLQEGGIVILTGIGATGDPTEFALRRVKRSGRQDRRFGAKGRVAGTGRATAIVIGGDGAILVGTGGPTGPGRITRYLPHGVLDPGFGTAGVATPATAFGAPIALFVGANGIVAVDGRLTAVRLSPSGSLDPTFGIAGVATPSVPGADWRIAAFAADGGLVAGGWEPFSSAPLLARLRPDWSPDWTRRLDDRGVITELKRMVVRSGGDALLLYGTGGLRGGSQPSNLVAITMDGTVGEGVVVERFGALAMASRGSAFVAGPEAACVPCTQDYPSDRTLLRRLTPQLAPDPGFGREGTVLSVVRSSWVFDLVVQLDGRVVTLTDVLDRKGNPVKKLALQRYRP